MNNITDIIYLCKQGWLQKRGEHIKTWRPRYFNLYSNGYFIGYNSNPTINNRATPNNTFFIKDCKIITTDKPKQHVFIVQCLGSDNSLVERVFAANSIAERDDWINSIQNVALALNGHCLVDINGKSRNKITLHDFEFLKVLGKGTFGKVILCRERNTQRICAMKILKKNLIIQKNEIQHTQTENKVMKMMNHPFITSLIYSFQTVDRLCLVMTYANGGELFFHLSREKRFSEEKSKFYCAEIILAIGYLHEYDIMYRDIKLENILLDNEGHIKLADFGLCKMNMTLDSKTHTFCGTPEYLAPEILTNSGKDGYGRAIDWYALGILLYEMLVGRLPYSNKDVKSLFENIVNQTLEMPYFLSLNSKRVLNGLLEKDPQKRLGSSILDYKEIQLQSWFSNINWNDLLNKKIQPPFKPIVNSELDTRYFDKEFTGECVQFTPPDNNDSQLDTLNNKYFDSFSYYGSKTSLTSLTHNSNHSLNKFDAQSLLQYSTSSLSSSKSSIAHKNESITDNNCYPCVIQYSDNKGQLYESQTYIPMVIDGQAILNNLIKSDYHLYEPSYLAMSTMLNPPKKLKLNQQMEN